jgi:hypothetical protein
MTRRDLGSATQTGLVFVVILLAVKDKVTASHKNLSIRPEIPEVVCRRRGGRDCHMSRRNQA